MKINQKTSQKLEQNLMQGYDLQMVQKLHLLPGILFAEYIEEYCLENTALRLTDGTYKALESDCGYLVQEETLYDHLSFQIRVSFEKKEQEEALFIAASLDRNGFYDGEQTPVSKKMQFLDPIGIAAKGPREAMLVQLHKKPHSLAYAIVKDSYLLFLKKDLKKLAAKHKASVEEVKCAIASICTLNPFPGRAFEVFLERQVVPEMILEHKGKWKLTFVKDYYPSCRLVKSGSPKQIENAKKFLYQLNQRKKRLEMIVAQIVKKQEGFLLGIGEKQPLYRDELLAKLSISESTLSRILSEKYIETPLGVLPLGFFFTRRTTGVAEDSSVEKAKKILKLLINQENKKKPHPDEVLVDLMKREGIITSRRSIAKYRKALNIASSHERKNSF